MKITPKDKRIGTIKPGDPFDLPDAAAKHLIKLGIVKEYTDPAPTERTRRQYKRRDLTAEA